MQHKPQTLRDYQEAAKNAVIQAWHGSDAAPLVFMATGGGKTSVIAQTMVETVDPRISRALVLAHREELIFQLRDRIANQYNGKLAGWFGSGFDPGIGLVMGTDSQPSARIVVATRQSLHAKRLAEVLSHGAFDVLVIDEAHHATADNTYGTIVASLLEANPDLKILGVTATPKRQDDKALGTIFSSIAYSWSLDDGIGTGYLSPVTRLKIKTEVNLTEVKTTKGDYAQGQLAGLLAMANWKDLCLAAYKEHVVSSGRACLAFMPSVEMSIEFADALRCEGISIAHLDGTTPKDVRRQMIADYATGKLQAITNFGVLDEGVDVPRTSAIFFARPTRSAGLFTQIIGRGMRPFPGKTDCLLVDLTVEDARALKVATLLGKMLTCGECGNDYYLGFPRCPICGADKPQPKQGAVTGDWRATAEQAMGAELVAAYSSIFEQTFAAWHMDAAGFLSCTLDFDTGALVIVPPTPEYLTYRLAFVPKENRQQVRWIQANDDLASLMTEADTIIRSKGNERLAQKDAGWRGQPASDGQRKWLSSLGVEVAPDLSKGAASQLITHALSVKRVLEVSGEAVLD